MRVKPTSGDVPRTFVQYESAYGAVAVIISAIAIFSMIYAYRRPISVENITGFTLSFAALVTAIVVVHARPKPLTVNDIGNAHRLPLTLWAVVNNGKEQPASFKKPIPASPEEIFTIWRDPRPALLALGVLFTFVAVLVLAG